MVLCNLSGYYSIQEGSPVGAFLLNFQICGIKGMGLF